MRIMKAHTINSGNSQTHQVDDVLGEEAGVYRVADSSHSGDAIPVCCQCTFIDLSKSAKRCQYSAKAISDSG